MRTRWEEQELPPVDLEFIFEGGRFIEKLALQQLEDAKIEIAEQQRDFEWKQYQITGHVDCRIKLNGVRPPCEIKGISPFEWDKIDSAEDMLLSKRVWVRGYPAQLQLYMLMATEGYGVFYLLNKLTYQPKAIWMTLDYQFCEGLIKKAERINKHIAEKTLPDRCSDFDVCSKCSFRHICLPDLKQLEGLQIIDNERLENLLLKMEETKEVQKEYKRADEEVKKIVEGKDKLLVGNFFVSGKWIKGVKPATIEQPFKYWKKKIVRVEE